MNDAGHTNKPLLILCYNHRTMHLLGLPQHPLLTTIPHSTLHRYIPVHVLRNCTVRIVLDQAL